MNINKRTFKLVAFFALMIAPAAFVQAETSRTPKVGVSSLSVPIIRNTSIESSMAGIKKREAIRSFERYESLNVQNALRKQKCDLSQSITVGIGSANFSYTLWRDRRYISISFGPSISKMSASFTPGMCEPATGFFVNATLVTIANEGQVNSVTWYPGKMPDFERTYSTPTIGISAGATFKIWQSGS